MQHSDAVAPTSRSLGDKCGRRRGAWTDGRHTLRDAASDAVDCKDELHVVELARVTDGHRLLLALIIGQFLVTSQSAHSGTRSVIHSFTHTLLIHSLTHKCIHSLPYIPSHSLTDSHTPSLTHPPTQVEHVQVVEELPVVGEATEEQHVSAHSDCHVASSRLRGRASRMHLSPLHGV